MKLKVWQADATVNADGEVVPKDCNQTATLKPKNANVKLFYNVSQTLYANDKVANRNKWWGQYSANGYMDQTDPCGPHEDAVTAVVETLGLYGQEGEGGAISDDEKEAFEILTDELGLTEDEARRELGLD